MKKLSFLVILLAFVACSPQQDSLPRSKHLSVDTTTFHQVFVDLASYQASELHSLMVVQNDTVIYEHYAPEYNANRKHVLWSVTKTFTMLAVGFAEQDGFLSTDDTIAQYFTPEELKDCDEQVYHITIGNLLSMSSGLKSENCETYVRNDSSISATVHAIFTSPIRFENGKHFAYNNMDTYLVSVILARATKEPSLSHYLDTKLFQSLGISNYIYESYQNGQNSGAWGLYMTPEDMAKVGLFILHKGNYNGKQLLNEAFIDKAMAVHVNRDVPNMESDWQCGYCYQMWRCKMDDAVRADGSWGQYIVIMPKKNAVAVMTAFITDREFHMNSFWNNVYTFL